MTQVFNVPHPPLLTAHSLISLQVNAALLEVITGVLPLHVMEVSPLATSPVAPQILTTIAPSGITNDGSKAVPLTVIPTAAIGTPPRFLIHRQLAVARAVLHWQLRN